MSDLSSSWEARVVTTVALVAALLCASAWVAIPIGAVPITLQVFIVLVAGLILTPMRAALAVLLYLALGAVGVPVYSGGQGGLGVLLGPTGGYLIGFAVAAPTIAMVRRMFARRLGDTVGDTVGATVGVAVIYLVGWLQLAAATAMGLGPAFLAGVVPFVAFDAAKGVAAIAVVGALRRAGVVSHPAPRRVDPAEV